MAAPLIFRTDNYFSINFGLTCIDAAKKKQLPAWIREGLNKMEREKQKKLERERMLQEKYMMDQISSEEPAVPEAPVEPIQNFTQVILNFL